MCVIYISVIRGYVTPTAAMDIIQRLEELRLVSGGRVCFAIQVSDASRDF